MLSAAGLAAACVTAPAPNDVSPAAGKPAARNEQSATAQASAAPKKSKPTITPSSTAEGHSDDVDELWDTPVGQFLIARQAEPADDSASESAADIEPIVNPAIAERYLLGRRIGETILPETVMDPDPGMAEVAPVFDAVGDHAKEEYIRAALLDQTGYSTQAMQHYRAAVERDPDNLWLKNRAARAALSQNDIPRATQYAEEVLAADPDNFHAMEILATAAIYRDRVPEAKDWYFRILEIKPRHIESLENLARIAFYNDRDMEKTKEYCGRIMQIGRNMNAILWHAEASALTGDIRHAADLYEELVHYRPRLIDQLVDMARRLERQERKEDALELYRRGLLMNPEYPATRVSWEKLLEELSGEPAVREAYGELCADNPLDLRIQELYADYLARAGDTDAVVEQRQRMLAVDPRHIPSLLSLARIELSRDDVNAANAYFEKALAAGPEDPAVWRDVAMIFLDQNNVDRAEELLREAAILDPKDARTLLSLAMIAERRGDGSATESLLKRSIDAAPGDEMLLRMLGDFYRRSDRLAEASQLYEQVLAVTPGDTEAQLYLASLYFELADDAALDRLEKAAPRSIKDLFVFYSDYGMLAMSYAAWERARRALEHTVDLLPASMGHRESLSEAYLHLGEPELAEQAIEKAADHIDPDDAKAMLALDLARVRLYRNMHRQDEGLAIVRRLARDNPEDFELRAMLIGAMIDAGEEQSAVEQALNDVVRDFMVDMPVEVRSLRASAYRDLGDPARAVKILLPLLDEADDDRQVRFDLALTYGELKNDAETERYYDGLIADYLAADDPRADWIVVNAYNNLAYYWATREIELDRAAEYARKAIELHPNAEYIHDTVGWVAFKRRDFAEAEKHLKEAEKLSLGDPEILRNLGDLYRETNDLAKARQYYERALEIDPDLEGLRERHDALTSAVGAVDAPEGAAPAVP